MRLYSPSSPPGSISSTATRNSMGTTNRKRSMKADILVKLKRKVI